MKIASFEAEKWERECFERLCGEHDVTFTDERLTRKNVDEFADAGIVSTFIYSDLGRQVLQKFEQWELVATRSTGFDHVDPDYCQEHGCHRPAKSLHRMLSLNGNPSMDNLAAIFVAPKKLIEGTAPDFEVGCAESAALAVGNQLCPGWQDVT